jgi:two-component sensor histidine kinase
MKRQTLLLLIALFLGCAFVHAQSVQKCEYHLQAEDAIAKGQVAAARYNFIKAFEKYADMDQMKEATECGAKATALYYKESYYHEAFDLLRRIDQTITAKVQAEPQANALHYLTTKERMQMYVKLRKGANAMEQLNIMERQANASGDDNLKNDLLYCKTIYYYTFGQNERGNAMFKEMADKLTASAEYDKVDEVYQTLIANGRNSGNANMVAQSYSSYMVWKDSVTALKHAAEVDTLKQHIANGEAIIADKDSSLSTRGAVITGLSILAVILAGVLVLGAIVLLRFIAQTRKQKNTIRQANENIALKAKFINNIAAQLNPSLKKLDSKIPEVKALQDFSDHVQTLAALECSTEESVETEEIQVQSFCEQLMDEIRGKVKKDVELIVKAPKMTASVNKDYVMHILRHLLSNATIYTQEGGHITLEFKKRSAKMQQFLVLNTGSTIPEEKREDVFKPFLDIKDLSKGDGLGLPICKTMAQKMGGDLTIDPTFAKGTRFVLDLHA